MLSSRAFPLLLLAGSLAVCGRAAAQNAASSPAGYYQSFEHRMLARQYEERAWQAVAELIRLRLGRESQCPDREACLALLLGDTSIVGDSLPPGDTLASALRVRYRQVATEFETGVSFYDLAGDEQGAARALEAAGVLRMTVGEDRVALEHFGRAFFADSRASRLAWLDRAEERLKDERVIILVLANPPGLPYQMRLATDRTGAFVDKTATDTVRASPGAYIFVTHHPVTHHTVTRSGVCSNDYDCRIDFRF
jgi:hypothetical protein